MTLYEYCNRTVPDYYPTMCLDGYKPYQILEAKHREMTEDYEDTMKIVITTRIDP